MPEQRCIRCARRVPWVTVTGNISLTIYKGTVGVIGGSSALIADAMHSFTDIIGTTVILLSCRLSGKPADAGHPYGHGKAEFLSAAFIYLVLTGLATMLFLGGLTIVIKQEFHAPNIITLLGAVISICANVFMCNLGICAGKRTNSPALLANAFENRADAISSVAVVIGIALGIYVHPACDPLAAMSVGVIIFANCVHELRKAISGLMDRALPTEVLGRIQGIALAHEGVVGVRYIKTRPTGSQYWVDLGITVPAGIAVDQADRIAASLRNKLVAKSSHFHTVEVFVAPEGASNPQGGMEHVKPSDQS